VYGIPMYRIHVYLCIYLASPMPGSREEAL
jgi:hypothetical protein